MTSSTVKIDKLLAIFTSPDMGRDMVEHNSIKATAGIGLEGDRYSTTIASGFFSSKPGKPGRIPDSDRQVTLISIQAIDAANAELAAGGLAPFKPVEIRRNLIVDVDAEVLNELVGKTFEVQGLQMEGVELSVPCDRPPILVNRKQDCDAFLKAFDRRGGLKARVLSSGVLSARP
jgi:MOSC domain-containing protein YiiM